MSDLVGNLNCLLSHGKAHFTYVDSMSSGSVRRELTEPVNKHLYIRPENIKQGYVFKDLTYIENFNIGQVSPR